MQQELRAGYHASTDNINLNKVSGAPGAVYAPAGDAWQAAGFPLSIYHTDIYHANNRGTLLNSLVLYSTIYKDPTVDDINLTAVLTSLQLTTTDLQPILAAVSSVIAVPEPATMMLSEIGAVVLVLRAVRAKRRSA